MEEKLKFKIPIQVVLSQDLKEKLEKYCEDHREEYNSTSHFGRSAIIKLLRHKGGI